MSLFPLALMVASIIVLSIQNGQWERKYLINLKNN